MVSSTGTFVSCKDYDDDIDQINNTLNDLKSQIAALQTEVSNGNWVTSLTPTDGGFTVTFKDGKTYTIVNGKDGDKGETGEAGKDGNSVEVKDGYWYINGEKTDYVAVIKEDLGKALVPYVENGVWVFYDKDGNPVPSTYKAVGNAWAVKANGSWTLHIPDVEGNDQTIELPGAASVITGLEIKSKATDGSMVFELAKGNAFVYTSNDLIAKKDWKGTKEIPADGAFVYTALLCRVTESQHNRIRTRPIWAFTKRRKNNAQFKNKRTCTDRFIHSHYHYHGIHTTRIYSARSYQRYDYSHSGNPWFTFLRT